MAEKKEIGKITHYFDHLGVAVVELVGELRVGDEIKIVGHGVDFKQKVDSIQEEHTEIETAKKGMAVGLKVAQKVHEGTKVFLV